MKESKFFSLNWRDVAKGFLMAVLTPVVVIIQQSLEAGIFILDWKSIGLCFEKEKCKEAVISIVKATNGNFRLINRLFSQIKRILSINKLDKISKDVVEAACDCLVIGVS